MDGNVKCASFCYKVAAHDLDSDLCPLLVLITDTCLRNKSRDNKVCLFCNM
jgi:hypothetical protein